MMLGIGNTPSFVKNGIPIPFIEGEAAIQGRVTLLTKRNNIDVYDVTFTNNEVKETLTQDKIYLIHIPNQTTITDSPIDLAMFLPGTESHAVDYYGYRYSDAAATFERRDIVATRFKDRFPGQFFASAKARVTDAAHGNALAQFEADNGVVFRRTDNVPGAVRIDPAGALYVVIANEATGIDLSPRTLIGCGNAVINAPEQCDDGNTVDTDSCRNDCTVGTPLPFGSGSTTNGPALALTVRMLPPAKKALAAEPSIPLFKVDVSADREPVRLQTLSFRAESGSLANANNYTLWKDTNVDGVVDKIMATGSIVSSKLTFALPSHSGAVVGSGRTVLYEVHADVPTVLVGDHLRLAFATSSADYVTAKIEGASFQLVGIQTDTNCQTSSCDIVVLQQPSTFWGFTDHQLLMSVLPLSATGTAFTGDTERPLVRFSAEAVKGNVSLKTLAFQIQTGALLNATYSLWSDSDADGEPDAELLTSTSLDVVSNAFTLFGSQQLTVIPAGESTVFEIRAAIANVIIDPLVLRVGFATGSGNFIRASVGSGALAGIKLNGVCTGSCAMSLTTRLSTLWTLEGNMPVCGNAELELGEQCDDGDTQSGDGCNAFCEIEGGGGTLCGNSVVEAPTEECDDGGTISGDGCSATCQAEVPECGDAVTETPEECDDGNSLNTDACTNACELAACGDTFIQGSEECDDGNSIETDDCDNSCNLTTPTPSF